MNSRISAKFRVHYILAERELGAHFGRRSEDGGKQIDSNMRCIVIKDVVVYKNLPAANRQYDQGTIAIAVERLHSQRLSIQVCASRPEAQELQAVLRRAELIADRHMDDAGSHQLAGLSRHPLCAAAGPGKFFRTASRAVAVALRGRVGRPVESPHRAEGHASSFHAGIVCSGGARTERKHRHLADHSSYYVPGRGECVRYAGTPGLSG